MRAGGGSSRLELPYLDERLGVVEKPAGLIVHEAPGRDEPTLVDLLFGLLGGGERWRPGIVHRLDRDTSGLMLFARDEETHTRLASMIAAREVERTYTALVQGRPRTRSGTIDAPIGRDRRRAERKAVRGRGARAAVTHFEVIESMPADTLLGVRLETGRTHQIRVHLGAIGLPVAGDATYGAAGRHGLERQFLHASRLRLTHPFTGQGLDLASRLPDELEGALTRARGYTPSDS